MRRQQTIPHGLLYSMAPTQLAHLHISDDMLGDEFDWDESTGQYDGDTLTSEVIGFLKEFGED